LRFPKVKNKENKEKNTKKKESYILNINGKITIKITKLFVVWPTSRPMHFSLNTYIKKEGEGDCLVPQQTRAITIGDGEKQQHQERRK
jgi:hypothetical protein